MRRKRFTLLLLLPFSLLGQPSEQAASGPGEPRADEAGENVEEEPVHKPIQFSVFVWPAESILLGSSKVPSIPRIFYESPTGTRMVPLSRNSSTPLYTYVGPQPLELFDVEFEEIPPPPEAPPGTPPRSERIKLPRIRVEVPEAFSRVTLVMMPGKTRPDGTIMTLALPYDAEVLQPGMTRIYNSTKKDLILQFKDRNGPLLRLGANRHTDFTPSDLFDVNYVRVFGYTADEHGTARRVHVSQMLFEEDKTNFFILYSQGRRVRKMRIGGHEAPPEPTPTPDGGEDGESAPERQAASPGSVG